MAGRPETQESGNDQPVTERNRLCWDVVGRLQTGTALPRISLDDLLDIKVPVPDLETQGRLESRLLDDFARLVSLRAQVERQMEELPRQIQDGFIRTVEESLKADVPSASPDSGRSGHEEAERRQSGVPG